MGRTQTGRLRRPVPVRFETRDLAALAGILVAAWVGQMLWAWLGGERLDFGRGLGFDGQTYARISADPGVILEGRVTTHRIQRVLPSLVVFLLLRPFGAQGDVETVIALYQVLNLMALLASAWLWFAVCRRLGLSRAAGWVGGAALLLNYPALKISVFYPVLTDRFGFLLGMFLVWAMVTRRRPALLAVAVVGSFTWPTVAYAALILLVMSRKSVWNPEVGSWRPWWGIAAAGAATTAAVAVSLRARSCGFPCVSPVMTQTVIEWAYPLSVALFAVLMFLALQPLAARLSPRDALAAVDWRWLLVAAALVYAVMLVQEGLGRPSPHTMTRTMFNTYFGAAAKPLGFLVIHTTYYGPAVLVAVAFWRRLVAGLSRFGPGAVAVVIVFVLLGFSTESRILVSQWPVFALGVALVAEQQRWRRRQVLGFVVLALVVSRFWLPIHRGPITTEWKQFPSQWYFMSNGPTTTAASYLVWVAVVAGTAAALWLILRSRTPDV